MKSRSLQNLGLLATLGAGATVAATDGVLHMGIQRRSAVDGRPIVRRASSGSVTESLINDPTDGLYLAEVQVGTPPQTVKLQLDTGSSDTWFVYTGSSICEQGGCTGGAFDPSKSSTFDELDKGAFQIAYADKTSATGDYFTDIFSIGGVTLQNLTMGVGLQTDIPFGLVGVGFPDNEAGVASDKINEYRNLPVELVSEKIINTVAFSLWLNDLESSSGSILFGGVDTAKFTGPLTRLKLYPTEDESVISEYAVALTSVTAVSKSGTDKLGSASFPAAVVLDSGTTHSFLPTDLVEQMYKEANVAVDNDIPNVPCSYINSQAYFSFGFGGVGGAVVNVSMSELVLEVVGNYTSGPNKGQNICRFGIEAVQSGGSLVLGDTFLRSAFVVYDLMNNEAALAQTKFNVSDSNVVAFASLSATVPSATPAPSQSALSQGVVSSTPTSYAAAASFTAASSGAAGRIGGGAGLTGVTLAAMVSLGVGFVGFLAL